MEQYTVTGMSCAACSSAVEKAVSKVAGVDSCSVNLLTNSMKVEGDAQAQEIIHAVEQAGYGASLKVLPAGAGSGIAGREGQGRKTDTASLEKEAKRAFHWVPGPVDVHFHASYVL